MKILNLAAALGLTLLCAFFSSPGKAGEALESLNVEIEQKATRMDQKFGVLLTYAERTNLKIGLIVARLKAKKAQQPEKTIEDLVGAAITTYEITDPVEQRQLLIETEASFGGGGTQPPCC